MPPHPSCLVKLTESFTIKPWYEFPCHQLPVRISPAVPPALDDSCSTSGNLSVPTSGNSSPSSLETTVQDNIKEKQLAVGGKRLYSQVQAPKCPDGFTAGEGATQSKRRKPKAPKRLSDEQQGQTEKQTLESKAWNDVDTWRLFLHHTMFLIGPAQEEALFSDGTVMKKPSSNKWRTIESVLARSYGMNRSQSGLKNRYSKLSKNPEQLSGLKELGIFENSKSQYELQNVLTKINQKLCELRDDSSKDYYVTALELNNKKKYRTTPQNTMNESFVPKNRSRLCSNVAIANKLPHDYVQVVLNGGAILLGKQQKKMPVKTTSTVDQEKRPTEACICNNDEIQRVYELWASEPRVEEVADCGFNEVTPVVDMTRNRYNNNKIAENNDNFALVFELDPFEETEDLVARSRVCL